jgi:hypothetical protein
MTDEAAMNVSDVLKVPKDEISFIYPAEPRRDGTDQRFKFLRVDRRGLRQWDSYEEVPPYLNRFLELPTHCPSGWRPIVIGGWDCYAGSELLMLDKYKSTLIHRVNIALGASVSGISIIGTPRNFPSYGTDENRQEGESEVQIGPDLVVLDGDPMLAPSLRELESNVIAVGDAKLKPRGIDGTSAILPGTLGCYESYLAQSVQYCIDFNIPFGFVLTNLELVLFQLVRQAGDSQSHHVTTRSMRSDVAKLHTIPSDFSSELDFSSPIYRRTYDWIQFDDGDSEIPLVTRKSYTYPGHQTTPTHSRRQVFSTPASHQGAQVDWNTPSNSSQGMDQRESTPCPVPHGASEVGEWPQSSQYDTATPSVFEADIRADNPTHVLIRSCPATNEDLALRLYQLIMLAKRTKDLDVLEIGPWKYTFLALDDLATSPTSP